MKSFNIIEGIMLKLKDRCVDYSSTHRVINGLNSLLFSFLYIFSINVYSSDYHERPGKTVLYPYHELYHYNYKEDPFRLHFKKNKLTFVSLSNTITIDIEDIIELSLVNEVPRLRGKLLYEFDQDDLSFLSKLYLRIKTLRNDGQELNHFLTLDFKIKSKDELKALREDIRQVNDLHLKTSIIIRDYNDIYNLIKNHKRQFFQFPLLSRYQGDVRVYKRFFKRLESELNLASHKNYHTEKNHMGQALFSALDRTLDVEAEGQGSSPARSRLFRSNRSRARYQRIRMNKNKENIWRVQENLKIRKLPSEMVDFKRRRLQDEFCSHFKFSQLQFCAGTFTGQLLFPKTRSNFADIFTHVEEELNEIKEMLKEMTSFLSKRTFAYIHKNEQDQLDGYLLKVAALDEFILQSIDLAKITKHESFQDIENNLKRVRLVMWSKFLSVIIKNDQYDISRFYDEGHFYKAYGENIFKDAVTYVKREKTRLQPFNWAVVDMSELADDTKSEDFLKDKDIQYALNNLVSSELEAKGTELGEGLVNVLGQVFKKRSWVPYLRVSTMFRDNFMTSRRDYAYSHLFAKDGMKPGDIILEKDMQANTDVLIPGYWVHAALYLGSIKDLKAMGLWDDPKMAVIRYEIEEYKRSVDRQFYLKVQWKNDLPFEEIPWFYESDRPGVGVHPLHKFMQTDGMAVLRPTHHYDRDAIANVFYRANERMYFPYDYVHNVRSKFSVSCSKVILKLFNQVTFPVTKYLNYVSVSPDQIGQPVSKKPDADHDGELKLIMFFDGQDKGELRFHHKLPETFGFYPKYLEFTGAH